VTIKRKKELKAKFHKELNIFAETLKDYVSDQDDKWTIKGFIDIFENIYTISADTKVISKILEIHLYPLILDFATKHNYKIELASHQNWYPDLTFISKVDENIKYAVDFKTTYRLERKPNYCNGFTLGSHGKYFTDRKSSKNIQYPYSDYIGHYCIGILYSRTELLNIKETKVYTVKKLSKIPSVIYDFKIFTSEKWKIASDKSGSGNTANIGSIKKIEDLLNEKGVFIKLGEKWFDDYWMNYGKIKIEDAKGQVKKITSLEEFLKYKGKDPKLANKSGGKNE